METGNAFMADHVIGCTALFQATWTDALIERSHFIDEFGQEAERRDESAISRCYRWQESAE